MGVPRARLHSVSSDGMARRDIFEVLGEWSDYLEAAGLAPRTIGSYAAALTAAARSRRLDPRDFTERDLVAVLGTYPAKGGTRGMLLRAAHSFYDWAVDPEIGEVPVNPARRMAVPRPKAGPAPRLSREELERIWKAAEDIDPRARPTLVLLYFTGARVGSFCEVTPADVRFDREGKPSISLRVTKGSKPYAVPVEAPEAVDALVELVRLRGWKPKMAAGRRETLVGVGTTSVWNWVSKAGEAAGVKAYPHLLRHSFASDLAEDPNVAVGEWVALMNHSDASQFNRYVAPSDPRKRQAVGRLGRSA